MRGRSPLVLMEQVIMLAVFALAAALCLRVFVLSDQLSRQGEIRDQALLQAQSAAEVYRHCQGQGDQAVELAGGSWDGTSWTLLWDESWQPVEQADQAEYRLTVTPEDSGNELLGPDGGDRAGVHPSPGMAGGDRPWVRTNGAAPPQWAAAPCW